jgi:hypothetical protein
MAGGNWTDVHLSFAAGLWTGKPGVSAPRSGAALLGIFAMLLQAVLFAEHRHPLPVSSQGAPALLAAAPATGHEAPLRADNDCQICFALGHHSAAPVGFVAPPQPARVPLRTSALGSVVARAAPYLLFRSRAPPRA